MEQRPGIRDVAAAAGVSLTTVSHALSGRGKVSEETRQRVEQVAARLGYAPNRIASALRRGRSGLLGFVSEEVATTPFAGRILVGAQQAAHELGRMLMIVNVDRGTDQDEHLELLLAQQVDAIVFASMAHRDVLPSPMLGRTKTVLVDAYDPIGRLPSVVPDEIGIGLMATRRLLDAGHRHIVHISVDGGGPAVEGRIYGYAGAMTEAGAEPHVVQVTGDANAESGREALRRAMVEFPDLTAVFAFNDQMAMGVYQEVSLDPTVSIPAEISVIGVDNLELVAQALQPPLTTIELPQYEMGRRAVRLAVELSEDETPRLTHLRIPGRLIERDSVGPPPSEQR